MTGAEVLAVIRERHARLVQSYRGVHSPGGTYERSDTVTTGNRPISWWLCLALTTDAPGTSEAWQLIAPLEGNT